MKKLVYKDFQGNLIEFKIEKELINIGRKEDNDIVLRDIFVSRHHCSLYKDMDKYFIMDKGSKFGITVNGKKVVKEELQVGTEIKIGNTVFYFSDESQKVQQRSKRIAQEAFSLDTIGELEVLISSYEDDNENTNQLKEILQKIKFRQIEFQKKLKNYEVMYRVGTLINSVFDFQVLIRMILNLAVEVVEADRGYIMLRDKATGEDKIYYHKNIDNPEKFLSRSMIKKIENSKTPVTINKNELTDKNFTESALFSNINSSMLSPLLNKSGDFIGAIYVDRMVSFTPFNEENIELVKIFSSYVGISIENSQLFEKIQHEEKIKNNLKRYLSQSVADTVINSPEMIVLGGSEKDVSIMFIDIRNFTPLSEKLKPKEIVDLLNRFFEFTSDYIFKHNGTLDKFIGDCIMTIYGAPVPDEKHADNAVKTALDIKDHFINVFKKDVLNEIGVDLDIGIGINSGPAVVGNIGTHNRMEFTAISDTVNTAERLESIARGGAIYVSEETKKRLKGKFKITEREPVKLKGKAEPVKVYEVLK